ncbi:hypothetical protein ACUVZD_000154 [Pseudomonas aeruginosa]
MSKRLLASIWFSGVVANVLMIPTLQSPAFQKSCIFTASVGAGVFIYFFIGALTEKRN